MTTPTQHTAITDGSWTCHPIGRIGKITHWGICGLRGRIVDVHRAVPNYDGPTQEAHARLIAASPDLYEACKALIGLCTMANIGAPGTVGFRQIQQANVALRKAEQSSPREGKI